LALHGDTLDVRFSTEKGDVTEAVRAERESLAQELAEMGLALGELAFGALRLREDEVPRRLLHGKKTSTRLDLLG